MKQKVLVVGAGGQLGREMLLAGDHRFECAALTRQELDIGDAVAVVYALSAHRPQVVINAAAYTKVDMAEIDADAAFRANAEGPGNLARACLAQKIRLIHVSTDFVFDGESSHPYQPSAPTAPLNEYGRGKLAGEQAVLSVAPGALVMRTGWVYSRFGGNFVKSMLRLMAERDELSIVADQVGTPTWARGLAAALWAATARPALSGIYHWSDEGQCSWYEFAVAIYEEASNLGLLEHPVTIRPIKSSEYPTPARRPAYSVLDKTASWRELELSGVPWRSQLAAMRCIG